MRSRLLEQLIQFKDNFRPSLLDDDIELVKQTPLQTKNSGLDFDDFVETVCVHLINICVFFTTY
jgi:hypothetical protein